MGAIVLDTNAVVRAILSPHGARRKLWLLLVYGDAVHRARRIREELQLARESGFRVGGLVESLQRAEASTRDAGLLPPDAPDDLWVLASPDEGSRPVHDRGSRLVYGGSMRTEPSPAYRPGRRWRRPSSPFEWAWAALFVVGGIVLILVTKVL